MKKIEINPFFNPGYGVFELRLLRTSNRQRELLQGDKWEQICEGDALPPSYMMEPAEAQRLANALWDNGIRPTQSKQSQGAMDAQGQHLQDMRAIAFAKLKVDRP